MSLNPSARCYVDNFCGRLLYKWIDVWKGRKNKRLGMGGCHSSVDSSVPSILQPWVWFTNTKTYAFCNLCLNYVMKRTKNYKKRPRIIHKNTLRMVQNTTLNLRLASWTTFMDLFQNVCNHFRSDLSSHFRIRQWRSILLLDPIHEQLGERVHWG